MLDCLRWLYCVNESERLKDRCSFGTSGVSVSAGGSTAVQHFFAEGFSANQKRPALLQLDLSSVVQHVHTKPP